MVLSWEIIFQRYLVMLETQGAFISRIIFFNTCHCSSDYIIFLLQSQNFMITQLQVYDCFRERELQKLTLLYCLNHFFPPFNSNNKKLLSFFCFQDTLLGEQRSAGMILVLNLHNSVEKTDHIRGKMLLLLLLLQSCDSVRPHRRQPTRLPHPWDSPGKNTGVGCHFLLQCMKVKSESEVTQSSRPHGLQPTRILRPWDFLGKSTGVACHCLLRHGKINSYKRQKSTNDNII